MKKAVFLLLLLLNLRANAQEVNIAYVDSLIYDTQYLGADESKADSLIIMGDVILEKGFQIDYKLGAIYGYRFKGWAYDYKGEYEKATTYFLQFLEAANEEDYEAEKIMAYGDLGGLYTFMGRHEEAKTMFHLATENEKFRKEQPRRLSTFYNNLGITYTNLGKRDSALLMYRMSQKLKEQTGDSLGLLNLKTNLASFLTVDGNFQEAEKLLKENIIICRQLDKQGDLWHNYINYGHLKSKQGYLQQAKQYYSDALKIANELESDPLRKDSYEGLAMVLEKIGDYKGALAMEQSFKQVSEKIADQETNDKISELRETYEADEREKENRLLNSELSIQKAQQNLLITGLIMAGILVAVIAFFFLKNRKKNRQLAHQNELINLQKDKLVSLNEEKNTLINIVSHDLRSPFNTISLWNKSLKDGLPATAKKAKEASEMIHKAAEYGQQMVNNILDIEKIEINSHQVELVPINATRLLKELIADFKPASEGKGIELLLDAPTNVELLTDPSLLRRALENLISNALKFSHPNSEVLVGVKKESAHCSFTVKDEGVGIALEEQSKLFSKYGKTSSVATNDESSHGLGLSIVKRITEELGGKVTFRSEIGKGSEFTITLPV